MDIKQVLDKTVKQQIARAVLESLPEWFGIAEAREEYIRDSAGLFFAAAYDQGRPIGFICLKETGRATAELYVMGVLKEYHRKGVGRRLIEWAKETARQKGYSFIRVKTVQMNKYDDYDDTNRFYQAMGFKEFAVFPTLWDENNPCRIYAAYIGEQNDGSGASAPPIVEKSLLSDGQRAFSIISAFSGRYCAAVSPAYGMAYCSRKHSFASSSSSE